MYFCFCTCNQTDSVHLSAVRCTFLSSATLQQQRGEKKKKSCNSHFFLGYHAVTGDRVCFWNGGKTDPSLPSLWGTEDWVSTTQETKQAKPKQQKNLAVIEKYILQGWEKLPDITVNVLFYVYVENKTKHCSVLDRSFPENPATDVKPRDQVHFHSKLKNQPPYVNLHNQD